MDKLSILSRAMIASLPPEGIKELEEILLELHEFYCVLPRDKTPILPKSRKVRTKIGRVSVRPEFPIQEDYDG